MHLVVAVCNLLRAGGPATHIVHCAAGELYDIIDAYQPPSYHEMDAPTLHSTLAVSGRCSALITVSGVRQCQCILAGAVLCLSTGQVCRIWSTAAVSGWCSALFTVSGVRLCQRIL